MKQLGNNPKVYIWDGEGECHLSILSQCNWKTEAAKLTGCWLMLSNSEPNPYMRHLAWANAFVITADSVSMISESCSTGYVLIRIACPPPLQGFSYSIKVFSSDLVHISIFHLCRKPVYVVGAERCTWKYAEFHKSLKERGVVRPFLGTEDVSRFLLLSLKCNNLCGSLI